MAKDDESRSAEVSLDTSLGAHLARVRPAAGLSLRQVEDATNKDGSNA